MAVQAASAEMTIAGIPIHNTKNLLGDGIRFAVLVTAPFKYGKTTMAATACELCLEHLNKPCLFMALEASDGGGTMSIRKHNASYITPRDYEEVKKFIPAFIEDTHFGGLVIDSLSEYASAYLKPFALSLPTKDRSSPTREYGIPVRGDYHVMGEQLRKDLNRLMRMTHHPDPNKRKHLIVTALEKERTDDDGNVVAIVPDLPGAMASASGAIFQTVGSIKIQTTVEKKPNGTTARVSTRLFNTQGDGVRAIGDRMNVLPSLCEPDFHQMWYKYVVPAFKDA